MHVYSLILLCSALIGPAGESPEDERLTGALALSLVPMLCIIYICDIEI